MKNISEIELNKAKTLSGKVINFDGLLGSCAVKYTKHNGNIVVLIKNFIDAELERILKGINIDEINRGDLSVRTSLLKEKGITNFYKVYKMQGTNTLNRIVGIGSESAIKIKNKVYNDAKQLKQNLYPKLDINNKTNASNALVKAIYITLHGEAFSELAQNLYSKYHEKILSIVENLRPMQSKLKWFFSSKKKKDLAIDALNEISKIEREEYFIEAEYVLSNINQIYKVTSSKAWSDFEENSAKYYAVVDKFYSVKYEDVANKNGIKKDLIESINDLKPDFSGLKCTLRSYQEFGTKYILHQGYVLLGDEMGLGKTVEAIASMVALRNFGEGKFLVVCPASVLINWCREVKQHSDLNVYKVHGDNRNISLQEWNELGGVAVTTYETLDKLDLTNVWKISMLVADEAHYVKNPKALRTKNLMNACDKSDRVLFMTGTALENKVDEMCFLISILDAEVARKVNNLKHLVTAPIFREEVSTVYLRRTREDVLQELPELIEKNEWCTMSEEERLKYAETVNAENFMAMRQVSWNIDNILNSSKAKRLVEICQEAKEEKRKVIVFSYFLNTLNQVPKVLKTKCYGPITGAVDPQDRQKIIDEFSKGKDGSVLLAQIQAGGTGVNIQAASCVVLCEPQLKPSTENQAISRAYRMGQVRNVEVFKLLCENCVDERVVEILKTKDILFENFADKSVIGEKGIEITKKMTQSIIKQEKERISLQENNKNS